MKDKKIIEKLGITLSPMQKAMSAAILQSNKDVVLISPTGSGKTYAYLLPLVEKVDANSEDVQVIVIVPSRELALQSANVLIGFGSGIRTLALYGGRPTMEEHRKIKELKPQVIFCTPGRGNDHLDKRNIMPEGIKWLVIDEFDKCLELGFQDEMKHLITKLTAIKRKVLLSATNSEIIPNFVSLSNTELLDFHVQETKRSEKIKINVIKSDGKDKLETLRHLLLNLGEVSSMVFVNYRASVERTALFLKENGFTVSWFHGGMEQKDREAALYKFSNGSSPILVSTDIAARGLDIPNVDNIIQYHLPETEDNYIHRSGRTARWDKSGTVFFILAPDEKLPEYVKAEIEEFQLSNDISLKPCEPRMTTLYIGKGKKDKISKMDIVGFLCKMGGLNSREIGKIDVKERYSYVAISKKKVKDVLMLVNGKKIKGIRTIIEEIR